MLIRTSGQIEDIKIANKLLKVKIWISLLLQENLLMILWLYKASKLRNIKNSNTNPYLRCFKMKKK